MAGSNVRKKRKAEEGVKLPDSDAIVALAPGRPMAIEVAGRVLVDRLNQLVGTAWLGDASDVAAVQTRLDGMAQAMADIKPQDETERMLAMQMVACNEAAMESLRRAALSGQTFEGRNMALKHAEKLMVTFTRLVETLDKHRGKGQQRITVQHVNVSEGGQAIVGNVARGAEPTKAQPALENTPEPAAGFHEASKTPAPKAGEG